MIDEEETSRSGPIGAVRDVLQSFWLLLEKRFELAATEFQEQRHRLMSQLVWLAVITVLGLMALFTGTCLIIALVWDTAARDWVMAGLTIFYAGGTTWCLVTLKRIVEQNPPPFSATIEEFKKDREWFQKNS